MANLDRISDAVSAAVAAELRARSARNQVRQRTIADAMGMSQSSISEKWRGIVPLTVGQFVAWCRAVGDEPADVLRSALATLPADAGKVVPLLPKPGPGKPHPSLPSVTRWSEDEGKPAAEDRDGTDEADYEA